MKRFKIKKECLEKMLGMVTKAVSNYSVIDSLKGVKICADESGLTLTGSDADTSIVVCLNSDVIEKENSKEEKEENHIRLSDIYTVEEPLSIVLPGKYLESIVKKMDSEIVTFESVVRIGYETDPTRIRVRGGNMKAVINGILIEDYPRINIDKSGQKFTIDSETIDSVVRNVGYACSNDESRPVYTGLNFLAEDGILKITGTDTFRVARRNISLAENEKDCSFSIVVSQKGLVEISRAVRGAGILEAYVSQNALSMFGNGVAVRTRLITQSYPAENIRRFLGEFRSCGKILTIDSDLLKQTVDRIYTAGCNAGDKPGFIITCDGEELSIRTIESEIGVAEEKIYEENFQYEGDPISIAVKGEFFKECLSHVHGSKIAIRFQNTYKPLLMTGDGSEGTYMMLLPFRTRELG